MDKKADDMEWKSLVKIFLGASGIVIGIWISLGGFCEIFKEGGKNVESITALFSGLAFAGMIVAIILQGKELRLQREELSQTREQLKRTAEANERAADLSQRNLAQQKLISETENSYIKCQILAQKYIAEINTILKLAELPSGWNTNPYHNVRLEDIKKLLKNLDNLKTLDGPISEQPSSTPEA